ncbi:MAG: putative 2-dehydropantoate 2-reductase [Aureliella sp.]
MTSYAVLGVGALGGLYGGLLARAGHEVHFLLHSDFQHVRAQGLRVDSPLGNFHLPTVNAYDSAEKMPTVDVVIVAWKSTTNAALATALPPLMRADSAVLVLQNGWDIERDTADVVGADRVLGGCCFLCSHKIGPGHIQHLDYGQITFGEYDERLSGGITPRMQRITDDFRRAGIDITPKEDLRKARWMKLMWNIPFNGLSVVLDTLTDRLMNDPATAALVEQLMREVRAAAAGCGKTIEESFIDKLMDDTRKMVPYASSMLLDYRHQRPLEVEAIFGNPLRAAQAAGVAVPRIEMLYQQLTFLNRRTA